MRDKLGFSLPNGIRIAAQLCGDADKTMKPRQGWSSLDVIAVYPDGTVDVLCSADYDEESGKLRIFAYDGKHEDMAFECGNYKFYNAKEENQ